MDDKYVVKKTIEILAPAMKVWEALTQASLTKKYMFGYSVKSYWSAGSSILWENNFEGKTVIRKGKVIEVEHGKFLKFTDYNPEIDPSEDESRHALITYRLESKNEYTVLKVTDDCSGDAKKFEDSNKFWNTVLPKLKELLEH